jgi:hypothetical protein
LKTVFKALIALILLFVALLYWSVSSTSKTFGRSKILSPKNSETVNFKLYDSVLIAASTNYNSNLVKNLMQGEQYRKAWSEPVAVQILFLDTLFGGGVKILEEGGGNQTHSLKLEGPNGIEYSLRSVNKDPTPLIPNIAYTLGLKNIVVDGIAAQHPFGALLASQLAEAANIPHTHPKMVFLPKQDFLKDYNEKYGNRLFLLEYESDSWVDWTKFDSITEIRDTEDLQKLKMEQGSHLSIDKRALIKARLFDFLIGDWDRHTKQWGWAIKKIDSNYLAIPIPGDRDNAFFNAEGIIPSILGHPMIIPTLRSFDDKIDFMEGLVYPFDRYFLIDTPENIFTAEAKALQKLMTNETIDASLNVWPKSIAKLNGSEITRKIKQRRDDLVKYAREFKEEIDRQGIVTEALKGSEDNKLNPKLLKCFDCNRN